MQNKELSNLGLAYKAGVIVGGLELVYEALTKNQLCYVYVAKDLSEKEKKRLIVCLERKKIPYNANYTSFELSSSLGVYRKVYGLFNRGKSFLNILRK